jgi:hypothetical protein
MPLTWSRTFDERWPDFTAYADGQLAGRMCELVQGPQAGTWLWSASGVHRSSAEIGCALFGEASSMEAAAAEVRRVWDQATAWRVSTGKPLHLEIFGALLDRAAEAWTAEAA